MSINPKSISQTGKAASFASKIVEAVAPIVSASLIDKIEKEHKEERKKIKG